MNPISIPRFFLSYFLCLHTFSTLPSSFLRTAKS